MLWWTLRKLRSDNERTRRDAAYKLWSRHRRAVEPLLQLLEDPRPGVRATAALALGHIKDLRAIEPLIRALEDPDPSVRREAVEALGNLGSTDPQTVAALAKMIHDPDDTAWNSVQDRAVEALGKLKGPDSLRYLIQALEHSSRSVRRYAARTLGEMRDRSALEPLARLRADPDEDVRRMSAEAMGEVDREWMKSDIAVAAILEGLTRPGVAREAWAQAWSVTGWTRREGRDKEWGYLEDCTCWNSEKMRALLPSVVSTLMDGEENGIAERILVELADDRGLGPLGRLLVHGRPSVRSAAARALEKLSHPDALPDLAALLKREEDPEVLGAAAAALEACGWRPETLGDRARLALARRDRDALVRLGDAGLDQLVRALSWKPNFGDVHSFACDAVEALGGFEGPKGIGILLNLLLDERAPLELRTRAAAALAGRDDPRAVEALLRVLENEASPEHLRAEAAAALGGGSGPRAIRALLAVLQDAKAGLHLRSTVAEVLGGTGDNQFTEALILALPDVGREAIWALREMGDPRALEPLVEFVQSRDEGGVVCETMADYIGPGERQASPGLVELAVEAIGSILEHASASASLDALRAVEQMADREVMTTTYLSSRDGRCHFEDHGKRKLDFSQTRQLARQELARRERMSKGKV